MNSNTWIELFFGHATFHGDTKTLSDFSGIWAENMESYNTVVISNVDKNLDVAIATFWSCFIVLPLKRLEFLMISENIFSSKLSFGSFFVISRASILKWSKNSSWNGVIVHFSCCARKESLYKKLTSFNSNWGKLKLSIDNITDSINVRDVSLFFIIYLEFSILFASNTSSGKVDSTGDSISSDGK